MTARILVIEDNPANLELMTYLLRAHSYEPLCASNGEKGLALAQSTNPEIVVCDIQLPNMDGFEVVRRLKSDPATRSIPVVAVTAFAMVGDRDRALAAGFDGYIGKPIVPESFVQQIEQFLGVKSSPRPAAVGSAPAAKPRRHNAHQGARVLVVDNTPANLDLMSSLLVPLEFDVVTAPDVRSALASARERIPDLIISDVHMPDESGFDFLKAVKADPALRAVPFILASATSWDGTSGHHAQRLGADLFLMRPMDPERFLARIHELLASKSTQNRDHLDEGARNWRRS